MDPTCCCAEWVEDGLSVHVRFVAEENALFANNTFIHYFAESELVMKQKASDKGDKEDNIDIKDEDDCPPVAFDGLSCTEFKLDKLKMGEQAKRIAKFEQSH